jgi:hypothetical protein
MGKTWEPAVLANRAQLGSRSHHDGSQLEGIAARGEGWGDATDKNDSYLRAECPVQQYAVALMVAGGASAPVLLFESLRG